MDKKKRPLDSPSSEKRHYALHLHGTELLTAPSAEAVAIQRNGNSRPGLTGGTHRIRQRRRPDIVLVRTGIPLSHLTTLHNRLWRQIRRATHREAQLPLLSQGLLGPIGDHLPLDRQPGRAGPWWPSPRSLMCSPRAYRCTQRPRPSRAG